jgi:hypothetical protein
MLSNGLESFVHSLAHSVDVPILGSDTSFLNGHCTSTIKGLLR